LCSFANRDRHLIQALADQTEFNRDRAGSATRRSHPHGLLQHSIPFPK
jgi:hypothetical protein